MISEQHAQQIIAYLGVQPGESIVLIQDETTEGIVTPVYNLLQQTHHPTLVDIGNLPRPLAQVPQNLIGLLSETDLCFYAIEKRADTKVNELYFRRALNKAVESNGGRVGNMLSLTPELVEVAFSNDANTVSELTDRVFDYMQDVPAVKVTSKKGTHFIAEFNPFYDWCKATGFLKDGGRNIMPAEVYTHPANVEGTYVIDGTYGYLGSLPEFKDNKATLERLLKNPMIWTFHNGIITDVSCDDPEIKRAAISQIFETENGQYVGEIGLPTNINDLDLTGVVFIDEKKRFHLAHGHGYPEKTDAPLRSPKGPHYDACTRNVTITNLGTGKPIMQAGKYLI